MCHLLQTGMRLQWRKKENKSCFLLCVSCHKMIFQTTSDFLFRFDFQPLPNTYKQTLQLLLYHISGIGHRYCPSSWESGARKSLSALRIDKIKTHVGRNNGLFYLPKTLGIHVLQFWTGPLVIFFVLNQMMGDRPLILFTMPYILQLQ